VGDQERRASAGETHPSVKPKLCSPLAG
jgi:hypothetical protein